MKPAPPATPSSSVRKRSARERRLTGKSNRSEFQAKVASQAERERLQAEEAQRRKREFERRERDEEGSGQTGGQRHGQNPEDTWDEVPGAESSAAPTLSVNGKVGMGDLKNELFREKTAPKPIPKPRAKLEKPFYKTAAYVEQQLGRLVKGKPTRTVLKIFRRFDSDGSGQINFRELQRGWVCSSSPFASKKLQRCVPLSLSRSRFRSRTIPPSPPPLTLTLTHRLHD